MVTHIPNDQIVPTVDLDNRETAALKDDLDKVIDFRISKSINMKGFSEPSLGDIKRKLISKFQEIKKGAMLSVDLVLSVMEQHGDEKFAVEKSASAALKRINCSMKRWWKWLYAWCTYANEPLSADQLQYILSLDKSFKESKFNVKSEIQGKSSSILYMTRKELVSTDLSNITIINKIPDKEYQEYVSFKNPAIKEHLAINNSQISERSEDARVEIFLTLCDLLCNRKGDSGIISAESEMLLQWYAARYLIQHFKDIDVEKTSPEQNLKLFESLVRIISNENGVSNMFEGLVKTERLNLKESYIETSLYSDLECLLCADSEDYGARRLVLLTAKVNIHKDKLMQKERRWQSAMLSSRPENLVKKLIQGHMESLARGSTFEDAEVPFKLIYRALYPTGLFKNHDSEKNSISIDQTNERMDTEKEFTANVADKILKYAQENGFSHPAKLSRVRTAIAILLLEKGSGIKERKKVKEYYEANLKHPGTSGPERFYSLLGLANYHSMSTMNDDNKNAECIKQSWENVKYFADQAITEKDIQKGPLGSKLNSERCYEAYLLKACALGELNDIPGAIESCKTALHLGMEYAPVMVHVLNKIVEFYTKTKQFDKLFDEVYQQSPLLKYMWLWDFRYYYFANNSDPMRKAAVLTRRVESLIQLYEEAIGFWLRKEEFQIVAILQYELSYIYRRDARVTKMAESTLNSLIDEVLRDTDKMKGGILQLAFPEMVDTLYEIYSRASTDHESSIKVDIIRRLEKLIENLKRTAVVNPITLSAAIITLAKMLKSSGGNDLKAAKFHAEQAFNLCIADLEDSIESNDGDALYLLARILMFAGLQEKARVAISLYFSKVDEYNENEDDFIDEKDDSYSVSEHSANYTYDLTGSMENGNYISAPPTNIPITDSPGNGMASPMADSQASISEYNSDQESDATSFDTEKDEAADLPRKSPESIRLMDHLQDSPKITNSDGQQDMDLKPIPHLNEKPKIPETDLKATRPNPPLEQNGADWKRDHNDEIPPVEKTSPPPAEPIDPNTNPMSDESQLANGTESNEIDEDLRGDDEINCNGPCETPKLKKWSYAPNAEPWYHCLDCKSVDLCSTCYDTQLKYFQGQGEGFWFKSCWAEHEFIKMPIENWRGVKNGVIRIGERRQLPWKDWIASVKKDWKTQLDKILVVD
ncbi:hypothetical protein EYC84_002888 [Monilinia fructicola]|uniref:Uncharacterized protein n=1 Tax=Monilinia fructicola TaxID=38448 RepID=A0A5M9JWU7_MONFR|nr:hypothetical protein EYC84_002888 [Monilinia fructicola]